MCLSELEETKDTKPFFAAVRNFYIATIRKMTKNFPFNDTLLKDLAILQPEKTSDRDVSIVIKLAKRFPQLQLNTPAILDKLREEFLDFQLSPDDLPSIKTYDAADKFKKPRAGAFWRKVG